jgi:hypothetical protein
MNPSGLRRYDDLREAAAGISRSSHCSAATILADLRSRGRFYLGTDCWQVVTAQDMVERSTWALQAAARMRNDEDVSDLPD